MRDSLLEGPTEIERGAVDGLLGPPESGWDGGHFTGLDGHVAYGGHAARARRNLLLPAQKLDHGFYLHIDEELSPDARGVETTARIMPDIGYADCVVCGQCALAAHAPGRALATLDAVARVPITIVSLPAVNLLLQDTSP